jgi:N-acetylglucosaminyldiphosphoundecaprenol N-acetyl-beta-D-mannosaminyltransferase
MKLSDFKFENYTPEEFWKFHAPDGGFSIMATHAEKYYMMKSQGDWDKIVSQITYVIGDGVGLAIGYWFLTGKKIVKCSGVDLIETLIAQFPKTPTYIWGTKPEIIKKAAEIYKKRGLNIVGFHDGYNGTPEEVIADIKKSGAKICFVGMSNKKQMDMVVKVNKELGITTMSAGGSFDVASGTFKRSPVLFQRIGLEWLWRMIIEPKRFKRLPALFIFSWYVIRERFNR